MSDSEASKLDLEGGTSEALFNSAVKDFSWRGVTVTVKDRNTKEPKRLLENVSGNIQAGEPLYCLRDSPSSSTHR